MGLGSFSIASRFCGPPTSGNGGYVAGRLAGFVETDADRPAVAVRLFAPPPLEAALDVREEGEGAGLFDGDRLVAKARAVPLELSPPPPPSFEVAAEATRSFRGFDEHVFPGCFVCGIDREAGDGLRIFPGAANEGGLFAATWTPDESLRSGSAGELDDTFVWAALDCPGAFSFPQVDGVVLLGEMAVQIFGSVRIGAPCVVTSWYIENDGRKHVTGTALYDEAGACVGHARATWIHVDADSVPSG
ncbi:MAG: hypothetical protein NXI30_03130 [bacterium]|nr:hypothetical protein [bacterium]